MQGDSFPCTLQNKNKKKKMKKIYLDPEMEVIELAVASAILVGSTGADGGDDDGGTSGSSEGGTPGSEGWGGDY